jgi:transcriptional regulator with XRE-family HTH domain
MGSNFRINLRNELDFQGVIIKELCSRTQIPIATLDSYLRNHATEPSAENAVKIARALQVSVEYLVIGETTGRDKPQVHLSREAREILRRIENLNSEQCKAILQMLTAFNVTSSLYHPSTTISQAQWAADSGKK